MEKSPFWVVEQPYEQAITWIVERLRNLGLQTTVTFDLQVARRAHNNCSCPHHGMKQCDCQMVVILVYGHGAQPVSLIVHSHEAITQVSFVDSPQQPVNTRLKKLLLQSLTPSVNSFSPIDHSYV